MILNLPGFTYRKELGISDPSYSGPEEQYGAGAGGDHQQ